MKIFIYILILSVFLNAYTLKEIFFQGKANSISPDKNGIYHFDIDSNGIIDTFKFEVLFNKEELPESLNLIMKINNKENILNIINMPPDFKICSVYKEGYMSLCRFNRNLDDEFFYQYDKKFTNWFIIGENQEYHEHNEYDKNYELKIGKEVQVSIDNKIAKVEGKNTLLSLSNNLSELFKMQDNFGLSTIPRLIKSVPLQIDDLSSKNVSSYNDIAYYLQQANANDEAIFLLEKIIEKFPTRTVAYLNLGDAYLEKNDKEKAKQNYEKYIELMKQDNKESKIPKRVLEFK